MRKLGFWSQLYGPSNHIQIEISVVDLLGIAIVDPVLLWMTGVLSWSTRKEGLWSCVWRSVYCILSCPIEACQKRWVVSRFVFRGHIDTLARHVWVAFLKPTDRQFQIATCVILQRWKVIEPRRSKLLWNDCESMDANAILPFPILGSFYLCLHNFVNIIGILWVGSRETAGFNRTWVNPFYQLHYPKGYKEIIDKKPQAVINTTLVMTATWFSKKAGWCYVENIFF